MYIYIVQIIPCCQILDDTFLHPLFSNAYIYIFVCIVYMYILYICITEMNITKHVFVSKNAHRRF